MSDIIGVKVELPISINFDKAGSPSDGGQGGNIFIVTEKMAGNGKISANGGDGKNSGKGGQIHIKAEINNFTGDISTDGGKSVK